jgi:hypothetical protein
VLVQDYLSRGGAFRSALPELFTFYPLAGQLYRDLFTNNFVDLDPSGGILDWDCTDFTYNGHDASDVELRSFGEQALGVPVFSALDGVVVATHDGEDDMHTSCAGIANYVILDHGSGRICYYWHLRRNSVQVSPGQIVRAGQPIGLCGSSGCSTGPHLHFATYDGGALVEPYGGPCNPVPSQWTEQTPIERALYVNDLNVTNVDISTYPGLPFDMPRRGTFVQGLRNVRFWIKLFNLPAASTWRVAFVRPDGSTALNSGTVGFGNPFYRSSWWWWAYSLNLNQLGTWRVRLFVNGLLLSEAPFDVVATSAEVVNRPPDPISASLWPHQPTTHDVLQCFVNTDLVLDDPDYDIVRYRYVWRVNGAIVRDVTTAAQADVLAKESAPPSALVSCSVTPTDGIASAPPALAHVFVRPLKRTAQESAPTGSATRSAP